MTCHVLLIFFVLSSAVVIGEGATAPYVPTDFFLFNCGDSPDSNDELGRKWTMENRTTFLPNSADASFTSDATYQDSGVTQVPYMTARIFRSIFTYSFPVTPGQKFVRLYFYPANYGPEFDAVNSLFSVTANGFTLLQNFSADLTVKSSILKQKNLIKEFIVPVNQTLNLTFTPSPKSLAFINGIEIVSTPDRLYTKGGFDDKIKSVGGGQYYTINNHTTALETVSRVNVGGKIVNEVRDSGMFRRWLDETGFSLNIQSGTAPIPPPDMKIEYSVKTPAYVAPDSVYSTSRVMGNMGGAINLSFNLTWVFPVDAGFMYLVRLHFCEVDPDINGPNQRVFSIFIGNQTAKTDTDVFRLSDGSRIPMYLDFCLYVTSGPLRLDLHPYSGYNLKNDDAILNGVELLKLSNSDSSLAGPNPNPPVSTYTTPKTNVKKNTENGKKSHILVIILAVVGSTIVLAIFAVVILVMTKKKRSNESSVYTKSKPITDSSWGPLPHGTSDSTNTRSATSLPSDLCRRFTISEIKIATNNFDDNLIVGKGGFGTVYKGRIDGGATIVAIKRLDISSSQGAKEFETELEMLSMLRHLHLVSLIGYCDDEYEMVLVYEYMPHGTLRDHLYKRDNASVPPLSWKRRLEICIGAARGIQYLHTGTKHTIIHRDIKTTNILLDEDFVAKVADFGLSKVGPTSASQTHVSTVVKGTSGYLDPEYYRRQVLTDKSDVYSFGVVLFEVMCSRPTLKIQNGQPEEADLVRWVKFNHKRGTIDQIVDTDLVGDFSSTSLEKYCEIAIRCVKDRGVERPSMNDVVWALEFALQLHEPAQQKNENNVDSQAVMPRGEIGTTTDGDDDLFSRTTEFVPISCTTDESAPRVGDEESGSSWGVFSEIRDPKAR